MTNSPQCQGMWNDIRCQLAADHDSAHSARDEAGLLLSWSNPSAGNARVVSTRWLRAARIPPGAHKSEGWSY